MVKNKKVLVPEELPEFQASIEAMSADSKIFVDKSLEIAEYVINVMEEKGMKQKELALKLCKSEAEISKILGGMQNLTLRTIAKLEAALDTKIVCTPPRSLELKIETRYGSLKNVRSLLSKGEIPEMSYNRDCKVISMSTEFLKQVKKAGAI